MRFPVSLSYTKSSLYISNVAKINHRTLGIYVQYVLPDMHLINEHNYILLPFFAGQYFGCKQQLLVYTT